MHLQSSLILSLPMRASPAQSKEVKSYGAVPQGEWLLQTAAASGLGRQVIQYAKSQGIKTVSIVRRSEQIKELQDLGCDPQI